MNHAYIALGLIAGALGYLKNIRAGLYDLYVDAVGLVKSEKRTSLLEYGGAAALRIGAMIVFTKVKG